MIEWLRSILYDKSVFVGYARSVLLGLGLAWDKGAFASVIPPQFEWVGIAIAAIGVSMRAGEMNERKSQ